MNGAFPSQNGLTWQEWRSNTSTMESTHILANVASDGSIDAEEADGTLANLIDGDHPFYCGPDSMVAPHLPAGSPERAALFDKLRETFAEDWAAAEQSFLAEQRAKLGDLYFVRVGDFLKIGRTTNLKSRMQMIHCHASTPPELIGTIAGGGYRERGWHRDFKHLQSNREWFRITPELMGAVELALGIAERI